MGVTFDALLLDTNSYQQCIAVCPLEEASVVQVEVRENFRFLEHLARFTLLRVEGTCWDVEKKRFVGGRVGLFNIDFCGDFNDNIENDIKEAEREDQVQRDEVAVQGA
jgi:hypothetical protein